MEMNRRSLLQAGIAISTSCFGDAGLRAYAASGSVEPASLPHAIVPLRSAENPYGPPESARLAVQTALSEGNRYPRTKIEEFKELLAHDAGLTPEHVIIGAGSIELMLNTGLYCGKLRRTIVSAEPTWDTTAAYAEANGAKWVKVPVTRDYRYDFDGMLSAVNDEVELVYICHPNNPTGVAEEHDYLKSFVEKVAKRTRVMIDEAFIDCLDNGEQLSMKHLVASNDNVVVSRTFSKLWGMAGFRVGYMLGNPDFLAKLKATIPALEMQSRLSIAAAMAACQDQEFMRLSRGRMRQSREMVYAILDKNNLKYIPSDCNFVTFEVNEDADAFKQKMLDRGVALKNVSFLGKQRMRVSCGTPAELHLFEQALVQRV